MLAAVVILVLGIEDSFSFVPFLSFAREDCVSCLVPVLPNPLVPRFASSRAATFLTWGVSILSRINSCYSITCLDGKVFSRVIE